MLLVMFSACTLKLAHHLFVLLFTCVVVGFLGIVEMNYQKGGQTKALKKRCGYPESFIRFQL